VPVFVVVTDIVLLVNNDLMFQHVLSLQAVVAVPNNYKDLVPTAVIGSEGSGQGQFDRPCGLALTPSNTIIVTDCYNHRACEVTLDGQFIREWGSRGSNDGQFEYPRYVAVSSEGMVFISSNNKIQVFDKSGTFMFQFGYHGDGELSYPRGIALDEARQHVYIADSHHQRIAVYTMDGAYLRQLKATELQDPQGIALYNGQDIVVLDAAGRLVRVMGKHGRQPGEFYHPTGITIDCLGRLVTCDRSNNRLQVLQAETGEVLHTIGGSYDSDLGQFQRPSDVLVTPDGHLIVCEINGDRLQLFR
jgi:tripartite motif-containing protein 71